MKPMRLVTKMRIATIGALVSLLLLVAIGISLEIASVDGSGTGFANTSGWFVASIAIFAALSLLLCLELIPKYRAQRRDAWREHVKRVGVPPDNLLRAMQGLPLGDEKYTSKHADVLLATLRGFYGVLVAASLSPERLLLRSLEEKGWVRLTFGDNSYFATVTGQTWAVIDDLRPKGWSPEDDTPGA